VIGAGDDSETHHTVQCPRRQKATDFSRCCGCPQMVQIDVDEDGKHGSVECLDVDTRLSSARMDVAEAAVRTRLGDILGTETTCVRVDVRTDAVADLLVVNSLRAVPVVDDTRRLVGIVSKTDLLRKSAARRRPTTVADIMTPLVHGLPEDAPVAYAISLMAFEGLHEVPIVDAKSHVIGMVTSTGVLRWVAQTLGYVVPGKVEVPAPKA
jgi:CBS-domain-containing membrane protein